MWEFAISYHAMSRARGSGISSSSALIVVGHVSSWPLVHLGHVRGGVGRSRPFVISPSGHLAAWPNLQSGILTLRDNWKVVARCPFYSQSICQRSFYMRKCDTNRLPICRVYWDKDLFAMLNSSFFLERKSFWSLHLRHRSKGLF